MLQPLIRALLVLAVVGWVQASEFKDGEFVQTARKAQFHEQRTHWHDLLGHHCPRFGHDRLVAVPLPKPTAPLQQLDEYKIQFGFDGDRHVTPWLKILGKGAPAAPVVEVILRRSGPELLGVKATVKDAPMFYQHQHEQAVHQFQNTSSWPKHLLVFYHFENRNEVDLDRGLAVIFVIGLLVSFVLALNAVAGAGAKLKAFLADVVGDADIASGSSESQFKGGAKAE